MSKSKLLNCQYCGKEERIPRYRWNTYRFCSRQCGWRWHNENGRKETITCPICSTTFIVKGVRVYKAKYCSRSCYYKAKHGSLTIPCDICGAETKRSPYHLKQYAHYYCSSKCRGVGNRTTEPKTASSARQWLAIRDRLIQCNRCSYNEHPEILVVHHQDRNRKNNNPNNLEILCPNCHALEHYGVPEKSHAA